MMVCIQHHPSRVRHLKLLLTFLDKEKADSYLVIEDIVSSVSGMKKCFSKIEDHSHLMVIQDDVLPCKDLVATARELIKLRPSNFISLFSAYDVTTEALRAGRHWGVLDRAWGLPCYIIPAKLVSQYLDFDVLVKDDIIADDVRMSMFLEYVNKPVYVTAPSLVEHLAFTSTTLSESGKVSVENGLKFRVAKNYIGFEKSGLSIDWSDRIRNNIQQSIGNKFDHVRHYKKYSGIKQNIDCKVKK